MDSVFLQQSVNAISLGAIYALFALGYAMVFSILGVLNLAHSAVFMWGAFVGLLAIDPAKAPILITILFIAVPLAIFSLFIEFRLMQPRIIPLIPDSLRSALALFIRAAYIALVTFLGKLIFEALFPLMPANFALPPLLAFVLASLTGGVLSIALEFVAFRPLRERGAARLSQLISSIGAALVLVNLAQFAFQALYNSTEARYPQEVALFPFVGSEAIILGSIRISPIHLVILAIGLVLMIGLQFLVSRTKLGQQMRAVAFNQRIASLLGIDVSQVYILTFFLSGIFGGAAGMLFGVAYGQITPFIGETVALIGLTAIVLGGLGSIQGAVLGGFLVAALQTFSTAAGGSSYRDAIVFSILFLVLLVRPQGLLGQAEQNRA
jgi:branched-chain amino acid transport system permease protein